MEMKSLTMQIAKESWPLVETDLNWFVSKGLGKEDIFEPGTGACILEHPTIKYLSLFRTAGHPLRIRV
jgi:hypothetical protein